ncbi:MAG: hypothetical protein IRZ29_09470 [Thermoflavifilum sp.]|nr:hypothetical protein [Thermoflavifilum sp.]
MRKWIPYVWLSLCLPWIRPVMAQTNDSTSAWQWHAGITYLSQFTYSGRRDSSSMAYWMPSLTLSTKPGFFLSVLSYLHAGHNGKLWEGISLTPGYVWHPGKKFAFVFSYSQYWMDTAQANLLSSLKGIGDINLMYQAPHLETSLETSYLISEQTHDWLNQFQIGWPISLGHRPVFTLKPVVALDAGTQTFYKTYYTKTLQQSPLVPDLPVQEITQQQQKAVKQYQLLSAELHLPLSLKITHWEATLTPYWIFPTNTPGFTRQESASFFFFTAQLMYHF